MSAPEWAEGDPQPDGVTAVTDSEGVAWVLIPESDDWDGDDVYAGYWQRRQVRQLAGGALYSGPPIGVDWDDIWSHLPEGATLREATVDEVSTMRIVLE